MRRVLCGKTEDDVAYYNCGNAYSDKGDYDRAIADYDEVLRLNPEDTAAQENRQEAFEAKSKRETAADAEA